jgi:hypothetical protein
MTAVDSKEGIEQIFRWARAHRAVLRQAHVDIAKKYGVDVEGVAIEPLFTRPRPSPPTP